MKSMLDTNTTMFLVPGLDLDAERLRADYGFINGYLKDRDYDLEYEHPVYMLFRPADIERFEHFALQEYSRSDCLVDEYDHAGGFVVLVYQFPAQYVAEFKHFLNGRYSRFRKRYINKLPKLIMVKTADGSVEPQLTIPYMACTRSPVLKKYWQNKLADPDDPLFVWDEGDELWLKPKMSMETLEVDKVVKELEQINK